MKTTILLATLLMSAGMAAAQTAPATPAAPAGPTPPNLTPAQQANCDRIQGERKTCRTQAQAQGLKGDAIRSAVMDCMTKVDPVAAKRMTCRQAGMAKSLSGVSTPV